MQLQVQNSKQNLNHVLFMMKLKLQDFVRQINEHQWKSRSRTLNKILRIAYKFQVNYLALFVVSHQQRLQLFVPQNKVFSVSPPTNLHPHFYRDTIIENCLTPPPSPQVRSTMEVCLMNYFSVSYRVLVCPRGAFPKTPLL